MTPDEILIDYRNRLIEAANSLNELRRNTLSFDEALRIAAKEDGVLLALDYLRAYDV